MIPAPEQPIPKASIVAFRVPPELLEAVQLMAAHEGISRSDVARRALIRDLSRSDKPVLS